MLSWISKTSSFLLKLMEDFSLKVPESVVPGINILLELAKWEQRRAATPKVIKKLCEKHNIDLSEVSSLEVLKKYIPEREIEIELTLAKSKIDYPSLTRYLHESHKVSQESLNELFDHFSNLHEDLRSPYLFLRPGETVLEDPPKDAKVAEPIFFRKTGPVSADIKNKKVYIRKEVQEIITNLDTKSGVLLRGDAASGKSVVARVIAYRWLKKGNKVRFIQLKAVSIEWPKLAEETHRFGKEEPAPLLVVEDAHLQANSINQFLSQKTPDWPKLLVTSRKIDLKFHREQKDHFKDLYEIKIEPHDSGEKILSMYFKAMGLEMDDMLKADIISASKDNLWLLSYALRSLEGKVNGKIDLDLVKQKVRRDLEDVSYVKTEKGEIITEEVKYLLAPLLIALSILYRWEIPTDIRFLYAKFPYPKNQIKVALSELVKMGEALTVGKDVPYLYALPHSALAYLYIQFIHDSSWEEDAVYGNLDEFCCDYAVSDKAVNGLSIVREGIFSSALADKVNKEKLARRIIECNNFKTIANCLKTIFEASTNAWRELFDQIEKNKLAQKIEDTDDLWWSRICMSDIHQADPDRWRYLWKCMDKKKLAQRISDTDHIEAAGRWEKHVRMLDPEGYSELWNHVDMKKLAQKMPDCNVRCFGFLPMSMSTFCPEFWKVLVENLDKEMLAKRITEEELLSEGWKLINFHYIFSPETSKLIKDVVSHIDKKKLAQRVEETDNIQTIEKCFNDVFKTDPGAWKELWKHIDKERFAQKILEKDDFSIIALCIESAFKIEPEMGWEFWRYIDKDKLGRIISAENDIGAAKECVKRIHDACHQHGNELIEILRKSNPKFKNFDISTTNS